jgi:hypothetical protein
MRLSDLTEVRQKFNETMPEYLKPFRETCNKYYNLTTREKFNETMPEYLKMEGLEFTYVNQVLQRAIVHENHAKEHRAYRRFKEMGKEKPGVNFIDEESVEDGDAEVCVVEWVDTPKLGILLVFETQR